MRPRIKSSIKLIVTQATPDGKTKIGERDRLFNQFKSGNISPINLKRLVTFMVIEKSRKPSTMTIHYGGRTMELTIEEYNRYKEAYNVTQ